MLGILFIYLAGISENYANHYLVKNRTFQEVKVINNYLLESLVLFVIVALFYPFDFSFLYDYKFYLLLFFENFSFYMSRFQHNVQKEFTTISFAIFSSVYLIFPLTYFYDDLFGFETTLTIPYDSLSEMFIYFGIFFSVTVLYFYDKIRLNTITHKVSLAIFAFSLVNTMYLAVKLSQTYSPFLLYALLVPTVSLSHFFLINKKDRKRAFKYAFSKREMKLNLRYALFSIANLLFAFIAILHLPAEFVTLFKRNSQIIGAYLIDRKRKKVKKSTKDKLLIVLVPLLGFYLYFSKII